MLNKINLYLSNSNIGAQKASRYACERFLEVGQPVLLLGSSSFHSGITSPADSVILSSKISRGYSFNLLNQNIISKISSLFEELSAQALGILLGLREVETQQLELALNISKSQQRQISNINHLQAMLAWLTENYFELPSWYGRINLNSLAMLQDEIFELRKYEHLFSNENFSFSELPSKDYLGYGVCNLIDSDKIDKTTLTFIIANLINLQSSTKPALVIENAQNITGFQDGGLLELLSKQNVFSSISITANGRTKVPADIELIDADKTQLICRSDLKSPQRIISSLKNQISKESRPSENANHLGALGILWGKTVGLASRKGLD